MGQLVNQPDTTGQWNFLYGGNASSNYSTWTYGQIGWDGTGGRMVLKFDLSAIPAGATIDSANIVFFAIGGGSGNIPMSVHRILAGNSDWTKTGSSWSNRRSGASWAGSAGCSSPGTDYAATEMGNFTVTTVDAPYTVTLNTSEVALMVANNYGILLRAPDSGGNRNIASFQHATQANHPKITINYTEAGGGSSTFVPKVIFF